MSTGKERKRAGIYRLCLLVMLILLLGAAVPVSAKVTSVKNIEKVTGGRFTARNGNWYYYDKDGQMAKDCLFYTLKQVDPYVPPPIIRWIVICTISIRKDVRYSNMP